MEEKFLKIPVRWIRSLLMIFVTATLGFLGHLFLMHIKEGFLSLGETFNISHWYLIPEVVLAYIWCLVTSVSSGLISPWRPTKTLRIRDFIIAGLLWGFSLFGLWFFKIIFGLVIAFLFLALAASFAVAARGE